MSSNFRETVEATIVGTIVSGILLLAPTAIFAGMMPLFVATFGQDATYLFEIVLGCAVLLFTAVAGHYYFLVLPGGRDPTGTPGRERYEMLRRDLANGGTASRIYSERLTQALDAVDGFFRDAGTLGQRAFMLQTPAALWTAPAFHRCLLLALAFPVTIAFLMWTVSGAVGPLESALGAPIGLSLGRRLLQLVFYSVGIFCYWKCYMGKSWRSMTWLAVSILVGTRIDVVSYTVGPSSVAGSIALTGIVVGVATTEFRIIPIAIGAGALSYAVGFASLGPFASGIVGFSVTGLTGLIGKVVGRPRLEEWKGGPWLIFFAALCVLCIGAAYFLSPLQSWTVTGPLLMFGVLLTLVVAPFDWFSLGLTRLLLRYGLERQAWWPYFYALVDACCAVVVILLLGCTLVIGVQTFNLAAVAGGGAAVLQLDDYFLGIQAHPFASQYWWLYLLFLSTMIPSFTNLIIGGMALTRGIPQLSAYLCKRVDGKGPVDEFSRLQIASYLAVQTVAGVGLGIAAQAGLAFVLFRYAMPGVGLELLHVVRYVADLNIPAHVLAPL
jgi:hypothetical protein